VTSFERAERNQAIVTARLRGLTERRVAEMYEVSERHVRRVLREYRESRTAWDELDPVEALHDTLGAYEALINEAEALTDQAKQESTRLGALKLRLAVLDARIRLVPGLGLVPNELERRRMMEGFRRMAHQIVVVLDRRGVAEDVQQEIVDTVEGRLPPGPELADGESPHEPSTADYGSVEPVDAAAAPRW